MSAGWEGGVNMLLQLSCTYIYTTMINTTYIYIYWGVRELSIDMPSKLSKRQPYSQSMKEFKRPHVHKKVAIVHPKKTPNVHKKVPNVHEKSA